tara:strand:+ start:722 stop:880 length:159 start_codon:yes stop_codon:yes gene_type:complete
MILNEVSFGNNYQKIYFWQLDGKINKFYVFFIGMNTRGINLNPLQEILSGAK